MIPTPATMMDAASRAHAPRWDVTTSDGQDWSGLLISGSLDRSRGSYPRSRLRLRLATAGVPKLLDQGLLPTGRDVAVSYRQWPVEDSVPLFKGRLIASALTRTESTWAMEAVDWSGIIQEDTIREGAIPPPATVADLVRAVVLRTLPASTFDISGPALTAPVPADLKVDGDPWKAVETACTSCGCEAYFNATGVCVVRPEPVLGAPVDHVRVGPGGTVTAYRVSHEHAYSRVELGYTAKEGDPPATVVGVWEDRRPDSPTSVERIGRVTLREDDGTGLLPAQADADAAAAALAQRSAGRGRSAEVEHVARPWIEPGDSIEVTFSGGPTETQMVEQVSIALGAEPIQTTTLRNYAYKVEEAA